MEALDSTRHKHGGNDTDAENSSVTTRTPRIIGTSDGINVDLPASAGYDRGYDLLIEEAVRR